MTGSERTRGPGRREGEVTLSGLRTFVAVAEAGSFSAAAASLGVSQPTVSVQLQALEAACGVLLMHRRPELTLTESGNELFVRARLALSRVDEFTASARDIQGMGRGHLTVGLSTPHSALPVIAAFMKAHPAISMRTRLGNTADLLADIGRCRIDVGVMSLVEPPPQFACALVAAPRLMVCMRADDPLGERAALRPVEIADRPFVMREEGSMTRRLVELCFAADGATIRTSCILASREALKEAVAAGLGLGAVFESEMGRDQRFRAVPFATQPRSHGVYAVALKESLDIPAVRAFFDQVPHV